MALGCVMVALLYLYLSAGLHLLSSWREARRDSAQVAALEHQNRGLEIQHAALGRLGTLEEQARQLGLVRPGEQTYIVRGLPRG
jgi:hypothetical protein